MEQCKVEIKTHTKGKVSLFRVRGAFERTERGLEVRYSHEGEEVLLILGEQILSMERESLSMFFRRGEETAARIRAGSHEGSLPIVTRFYALKELNGLYSAAIKYELGDPAQKFSLDIRIGPGSEER